MAGSATPSSAMLYFSGATAALLMFQLGYHLGELNGLACVGTVDPVAVPDPTASGFLGMSVCLPMSRIAYSLANGALALAGAVGALWAGRACDQYGRVRTMQLLNVPLIAAALVMTFAANYPMLFVGRLLAGLGTGGGSVLTPIYLSEVSPNAKRGFLGVFSVLGLGSGLFVTSLIPFLFPAPQMWRLMTFCSLFFAALQLALLAVVPETPVHLKATGRVDEAKDVMRKMTWSDAEIAQATDVESAKPSKDAAAPSKEAVSLGEFLTAGMHRKSLVVLVMSHATQQLSGINAFFSFSFSILMLIFPTVYATSLFYVCFNAYYVLLQFIPGNLLERYGRRPLMLVSIFAMAFFAALFTVADKALHQPYVQLVGFVGAVTVFSFGLSSIPFILTAEVVEPAAVGVASQVSLAVNNLSNFVILVAFPPLLDAIGSYTFLILAGYLVVMGVVALRILPETKGKTPAEVVAELRGAATA
ncbi:hypothetical protein GGF32_004534 [Allomyces javanicus]|nr:hypothetical protein GGF32_004534 [Allomyces javanicus]